MDPYFELREFTNKSAKPSPNKDSSGKIYTLSLATAAPSSSSMATGLQQSHSAVEAVAESHRINKAAAGLKSTVTGATRQSNF